MKKIDIDDIDTYDSIVSGVHEEGCIKFKTFEKYLGVSEQQLLNIENSLKKRDSFYFKKG